MSIYDRARLSDKLDSVRAERSKVETEFARRLAEFDQQEMVFSEALAYLIECDVNERDAEVERIVSEVDLSDCDTTEEQARAIAMLTADGHVRPKFLSTVLERKGIEVDNAYISRVLRDSPYWESVSHGVHRPKEFTEKEEVQHE